MSKPNSVFALMLEAEEPSSQEQFQALDEVEREVGPNYFSLLTSVEIATENEQVGYERRRI
jgi:hypothetical protein